MVIDATHAPPDLERLSTQSSRPSAVTPAILPISLAVLGVILALALTAPLPAKVTLGSLAAAGLCLTLLTVVGRGHPQFGLATPLMGSWMLVYASIAYGLSTVTILSPQVGSQRIIQAAWMPEALALSSLGITAFALGNRLGPSHILQSTSSWVFTRQISMKKLTLRPRAALFGVYAIGLAATIVSVRISGNFGYLGVATLATASKVSGLAQPISVVAGLRTVAAMGFSHRYVRTRSTGDLAALLVVAGTELVLGLLSAQKQPFVVLALAVALPFLIKRRRVPVIGMFLSVAVFVLVVYPFVGAVRDQLSSRRDTTGVSAGLSIAMTQLRSGSFVESTGPKSSNSQFVSRVRQIDNLALVAATTPEIHPYEPMRDLAAAPVTGAIPRAVWPDKPVQLTGYDFYHTYYGGEGLSASAPTFQGSLYLYGGPLVLIGGMAVIGMAVRALDDTAVGMGGVERSIIVLTFFPILLKQELDVASLLAGIPVLVATFYVSRFALMTGARSDRKAA